MLARHALLLTTLLSTTALAQEPAATVTVPALTPVPVRLEEEISSNRNKPGDRFRITVAEDVRVGGVLVIPAGSAGFGEVIHAAKSGAGGKPGELLLAARYVIVNDNQIRLRSFALGATGHDNTASALTTSMFIGPFAMFVKGGVITVPPNTLGVAKTALEFKLPDAAQAPPPAEPQAVAREGGQ